ncbi:MAG: peptide ABC transporter substrate-binding protein [Ardenticatenaceae bacterium]|nr:peptide ABC transporter substrate-binding protein [Ardenticatenaceae bacterium]
MKKSNQYQLYIKDRFWWIFSLLLVGLLVGCQVNNEDTPVVVTEIVMVEGEEIVVTRLVRQTISVTVTPDANVVSQEPVALDVGYVGDFPNVDPQVTVSDNGIDLIENLFVGLTNYNPETNQVEPELAMSWDVENGRIWTFHLRDDIFWVRPAETGTPQSAAESVRPVVAADMVYAIQRMCQRATQTPDVVILFLIQGCEQVYNLQEPSATDLNTIGVQAVNDQTLQITLTKPASHFLTISSMWLFHPVPGVEIEQLKEESPDANWLDDVETLLTSGPFFPQANSWGGSRVVLHRNPLWPLAWRGNVDIVNVNFLDSEENALKLWEAKSLDISPIPAAERERLVEDSPTKVHLVSDQTVFYLAFNFDSGVFREAEVRRAFSAAIDRDELVAQVYGGRALSLRHLTPPGVFGAPPLAEVGVGYSPDFARQQLEASGFRSCRLMPPITLMVSTSDLSLLQAELIRNMWINELNCEEDQIQFEQVQFGTLLANTRADAGAARPDIWELGWASYYPDAHNWVGDLLHCTESENRQNRPCSQIDDLIEQADTVTDPAQRIVLYRQIENTLFGADGIMPIIPLYVRGDYQLVQTWLVFSPTTFGGEQFDTYVIDAVTKELEQELERSR